MTNYAPVAIVASLLEGDLPVRYTADPQTGCEQHRRIRSVLKPRQGMTVGGGPTAMQATRFLALRGNQVILLGKKYG